MTFDWTSPNFFDPENLNKLPRLSGIDTSTGQRINFAPINVFKPAPPSEAQKTMGTFPKEGSAIGNLLEISKQVQAFEEARDPYLLERYRKYGDIAAEQQLQTASRLFPLLDEAGQRTVARNLAASQAYRAFAEQLPSNVQNIMASKQQQMASAALGEAELQRATAAQQQAASQYPGRFAGQYVSFG